MNNKPTCFKPLPTDLAVDVDSFVQIPPNLKPGCNAARGPPDSFKESVIPSN